MPAVRIVGLVQDRLVTKDLGWDLKKNLKVCGNDFNHVSSNATKGLNRYDLLL